MRRLYIIRLETPNPEPPPVVPTQEAQASDYSYTVRLTSSTATKQFLEWFSGVTGTLIGVTVFTDKIDSGDTWSLMLRGRLLKDNTYPIANTAIKDDLSEPIFIGDRLVLNYNSKGLTSKNIDLTPKVRYYGDGFG